MLIINPATLRHLHETVHRLARGLWFAYSGELVQDGTTIDSDNPDAWLEDAARLPFPDKTFGTISIVAALNHIPNREAVLKECHRLLINGGGRLIITMIPPFISYVWHHIRFPWDADQKERGMKAGEAYGMTREQINALCVRAGFVLAHAEKFMMGLNSLYVFDKSG